MIKTNYHAIVINKILKSRYVFTIVFSSLFIAISLQLTMAARASKQLKFSIDVFINTKFHGVINQQIILYANYIFYALLLVGSIAIANNIYERFIVRIVNKVYEIKWFDIFEKEYPYDPHKLQLILGQVHNEENLDLALKPKYAKIEGEGLFQNLIITGTIGTGKTITAIVQFALQLIYLNFDIAEKKAAMLFLDVKGTFYQFVYAFAKECGRWLDVITLEIGGKFNYNPLHKPELSEIELANRMRYILELFSETSEGVYWLDLAESTISELLKIIRIYNDNYITFDELHPLATKAVYREEKFKEIDKLIKDDRLTDEQIYNYNSAKDFFNDTYNALDDKAQGYIQSEIARMTQPFITNKKIKESFCPPKDKINFFGFKDVIDKGKIVLWKINANKEPKVAKLIAAYLKLDFQREIMITLEKKNTPEGKVAAERIKVTICDEYQEYVTKNDPDFYAQSREPRSITIVATQSYSSLKKSLANQDTMTNILLQSLVNKIWLRSDDVDYTLKKVIQQINKIDKEKITRSVSESGKSTVNYTLGQIVGGNKNVSSTENIQTVKEDKFGVTFLSQELGLGQAVCFISDGKNIAKPFVCHLSKMFEGRLICENGKITFTKDKLKIFKTINEAGTVDLDAIENSTISQPPNINDTHQINISSSALEPIISKELKAKTEVITFTVKKQTDELGAVKTQVTKEKHEIEELSEEAIKKEKDKNFFNIEF
jgi:hypothetical protein